MDHPSIHYPGREPGQLPLTDADLIARVRPNLPPTSAMLKLPPRPPSHADLFPPGMQAKNLVIGPPKNMVVKNPGALLKAGPVPRKPHPKTTLIIPMQLPDMVVRIVVDVTGLDGGDAA